MLRQHHSRIQRSYENAGFAFTGQGDTLAVSFAVQVALPKPKQEEPQFGSWVPPTDVSWMQ